MTETTPETALIWQTLGTILDPEFAISIVDLGLIYSVTCEDGNAAVVMTLTTPTCPSGAWIRDGVVQALTQLAGIKTVDVQVVFDPQWSPEMLSIDARAQLGWSPSSEE